MDDKIRRRRERLARDVETYLKNGGEITVLPGFGKSRDFDEAYWKAVNRSYSFKGSVKPE